MARLAAVALVAVVSPSSDAADGPVKPIPFVKQWKLEAGDLHLTRVTISSSGGDLADEVRHLRRGLVRRGVAVGLPGFPIRLGIGSIDLPPDASVYAKDIHDQAYTLQATQSGIVIRGRTPVGVFYGVQTLVQLLDAERRVPCVEITDWPDLAVRGVMVDPARANENAQYYERVIRFCAHYKINRIHLHLTDDQNVALYHDAYRPLMHPHAWRPDGLEPLVRLARRLHVELVPEIESLGHARVFVRHPEFRQILHQTTADKPAKGWAGTDVPGYTNVLCPASPMTCEYLDRMYAQAARSFPYPEIHVGCDEVDTTTCARCEAAFPGLSPSEWFLRHLLRCRELVAKRGRRMGLWGDVLLKHRDIVARIPTEGTVIYDWHYGADVSDESAAFFKDRGFDVIACPALMCYPHMILPSDDNYQNIRRFAEIVRRRGLQGLDTTIWTPTRYLSDVLWPGVAYAAVHAWAGSNWDEPAFYRSFAQDFFGSSEGDAFARAWQDLSGIDWRLDQFRTSCWMDDESLAVARDKASGAEGTEAARDLAELNGIRDAWARMRPGIRRNQAAWETIEHSTAILAYTLEHFLASRQVQDDGKWNDELLRRLDARCVETMMWIEADWDRNRFADDPYKADLNHTGQHLLHRFREMHAYHERLLTQSSDAQGL